uniref:StAR related lipid transfer domain containing 8 n=2 Tax=Latimeria chalumnae TaxID=7897 RepID=H3B067_LATCH
LSRMLRVLLFLFLFAELEAKKACEWLRAAGFPQYAQLYEDFLFPVDIASVRKDHFFLDPDSLKALCRRLTTLNKFASMKLEVHFHRKRSDDSEEEELCAISDRWAFQRDSKRWSRLEQCDLLSRNTEVLSATMKNSSSRESVLTDLSADLEASSVHSSGSSSRSTSAVQATTVEAQSSLSAQDTSSQTTFDQSLSAHSDSGSSKSKNVDKDKPKKTRTKSFLKKIESFRRKDKDADASDSKGVATGGPPLQQEQTSSESSHILTNESRLGLNNQTFESVAASSEKCGNFHEAEFRTKCLTRLGGIKHRRKLKPSGLYLEDYEMRPKTPVWGMELQRAHRCQDDYLVHLPRDHKPGTFPKSLSVESLCPSVHNHLVNWRLENKFLGISGCSSIESQSLGFRQRHGSCSSTGSTTSLYDNVPELYGSNQNLFSFDGENLFEHLDDILQHVHGLQQKVDLWSKAICPEMEAEPSLAGDPVFPSALNFEERSMSDVGTSASDFDSTGNSLNEAEEMEMRDRRDSGVGASLTRPNRKLRWHSFQNSHRPSLNSASLEINRQSAVQLNLLQKFSLLRLTAIMEKHSIPNKQGWTWNVPKFMKRTKAPDYKEKNVFGVPPIVNIQRTGQPLPQSIQQAMRYIRSQCLDQVGIFRKSGVKSRIQTLRQMSEASPEHVNYEGQSAYDVADMLKQYFRDLPEPVFTSKLTDTFLQVYQFVPKEQQLQVVQAAIVLMPDENREVLQTLLYFLSDIASAEINQMTAGNLAVCLAPSIFHLNISKKESTSPRLIHKKGMMGKPEQKDLNENMAATQGLSHMITECKKLFQIPHDIMLQSRNSYISADAHPVSLQGLSHRLEGEGGDFRSFLDGSIQALVKEASERFKGWVSASGPKNMELSYKKVGDGHPIRLWKVSTEVEAPPFAVLQRVLRERHLWDEDLLLDKVVEALEKNTEIYHYITDSMAPHPRRDFVVIRKWCMELPKGACVLVSASVEYEKAQPEGGVRAVLLNSQYLFEPCGMGRSRLTHICRADLRGRSPDWYSKVFGHLCAGEVARIRDSFPVLTAKGPETKV